MDAVLIVLRFLHIVGGVLWAGSAIFYVLFVEPGVKALGPAGPKFMQELIQARKYPLFMNVVSILTVLAGGALEKIARYERRTRSKLKKGIKDLIGN